MIAQSAHRAQPEFNLYRGIIPGWDNTARRQNSPTIVVNNHPELYGAWLSYLRAYARHTQSRPENSFLFINAWNEWGEGCHLEPDLRWGLRFLEETKRSAWYDSADSSLAASGARLAAQVGEIVETQHIPAAPEISDYRPMNPLVPKLSLALQRFPALHRLIRSVLSPCPCALGTDDDWHGRGRSALRPRWKIRSHLQGGIGMSQAGL